VITGLDFLDRVGMERINGRVAELTARLLEGLMGLRHNDGNPMARIYGPTGTEMRGGTVAFNLIDSAGELIDCLVVEGRANAHNISVRAGCFCNPGAGEQAFHYDLESAAQCFHDLVGEDFSKQKFSVCMGNLPVGAVRVSVGIATTESDLDRLFEFLAQFRDETLAMTQVHAQPQALIQRDSP
jgi:selenocysteine lyase/cysteine desulfurase